jgi:hypothetical protein
MNDITEEINRKLRETVREWGQARVSGAIIITNENIGPQCGGHRVLYAPTISTTLGEVDFKVARSFEDA